MKYIGRDSIKKTYGYVTKMQSYMQGDVVDEKVEMEIIDNVTIELEDEILNMMNFTWLELMDQLKKDVKCVS